MSDRGKLLLALSATLCAVTLGLIFLKQEDLNVYFIANSMAFMVVALAYNNVYHQAKSRFDMLALVMFTTFIVVVVLKVLSYPI